MKQTKSPNSVWRIVEPFYWMMRAFGLFAFTIDGDIIDGRIKTQILDIVHLLLVFAIQGFVVYANITHDLSLSRTSSVLIDGGARLIELFNGFNVVLGTCIYTVYRKTIWRIFRKCSEFDEEVKKMVTKFVTKAESLKFIADVPAGI